MPSLKDRRLEIARCMRKLQARASDSIEPAVHHYYGRSILNLDASSMSHVRTEAAKISKCDEARSFRRGELELLLLESAGETFVKGDPSDRNASSATDRLIAEVLARSREYHVAFAVPGLRMRPSTPPGRSIRIGRCEFCPDLPSLAAAYKRIGVPVRTSSARRDADFSKGFLVVPAGETVAVVKVNSSTGNAHGEARARLEEAYGFFVLLYDAVSEGTVPYLSKTRQPLISWQQGRAFIPNHRIASEPVRRDPELRTGLGLEQTWKRAYDIELDAEMPKLATIGFEPFQSELFDIHENAEMARRTRVALRWLARALLASEPEAKFLDYAIALESLFTASSSQYKIGALIRECVARIAPWDDEPKVRKLMGDLYGRRSAIVHHGTIAEMTDESDTLHAIVTGCLLATKDAGHHRGGYVDMLQKLGIDIENFRQDVPLAIPVTWRSWLTAGHRLLLGTTVGRFVRSRR